MMTKKKISNDGRLSGEIVGILLGLGVAVGISLIAWSLWTLIIVPVCIVLLIGSLFLYGGYKEVEFDETHFYYKKGGQEIKIPMTDILKISNTHWPIDNTDAFRVKFSTNNHDVAVIKVIPFKRGDDFESFLQRV